MFQIQPKIVHMTWEITKFVYETGASTIYETWKLYFFLYGNIINPFIHA